MANPNSVQIDIVAQAVDRATAVLKQVEAQVIGIDKAARQQAKTQEEVNVKVDGFIDKSNKAKEAANRVLELVNWSVAIGASSVALIKFIAELGNTTDAARRVAQQTKEWGDLVDKVAKTLGELNKERLGEDIQKAAEAEERRTEAIQTRVQVQERISTLEERIAEQTANIGRMREGEYGIVTQFVDVYAGRLREAEKERGRLQSELNSLKEQEADLAETILETTSQATREATILAAALRSALGGAAEGAGAALPRQERQTRRAAGGPRVDRQAESIRLFLNSQREAAAIEEATARAAREREAAWDAIAENAEKFRAAVEASELARINGEFERMQGIVRGGLVEAFGDFGSAIADLADKMVALGRGQTTVTDAISSGVGPFLSAMGQQLGAWREFAALRAAIEFGLGWATIYTNPAEGAGHFLAAASLGVAAATGVGGGGPSGNASTPQASTAARDFGFGSANDNRQAASGVTVNNFYGGVIDGQSTQRALRRAESSATGTGWERRGGW